MTKKKEQDIPTLEIDMDKECGRCGEKGAAPNELYLKCIADKLRPPRIKTIDVRFESASGHAYDMMELCIEKHFKELRQAKILILMDIKKREAGDMITLGRIMKGNDLTRHLTIDESGQDDGYDYIIFIDKLAWSLMDHADQARLMRHELRHTKIDKDSPNPFKIRAHTIEDFHSEVKLNEDDPRWRDRVAELLMVEYDLRSNPQRSLF